MTGRVLEQIGSYHHTDLFIHCDGWSNRLSVWRMRSSCWMSVCPNVVFSFILTTILLFSTSSAEWWEKSSNFCHQNQMFALCKQQPLVGLCMLHGSHGSFAAQNDQSHPKVC